VSFQVGVNQAIIPTEEQNSSSPNIPSTSGFFYMSVNAGGIREIYKEKTGFKTTAVVNYNISKKFFLSTGLDFTLLRYKRSLVVAYTGEQLGGPSQFILRGYPMPIVASPHDSIFITAADYGLTPGSTVFVNENGGKTSVMYLGIPLLAGTTFLNERVVLSIGGSFSIPIFAFEYTYRYTGNIRGTWAGADVEEEKEITTHKYNVSGAAVLQVGYIFFKNFQVNMEAQQFFTPMYKTEYQAAGKAKATVGSISLCYTLPVLSPPK
jgi:hypothetical protein